MSASPPVTGSLDLAAMFGALFNPYKHVVLAVSGGSDSMALLLLAACWKVSDAAPRDLSLDVATVDHGLRPDSAREAEWVAERARALGLTHTTLVWAGDKPATAIQERAREARYALLVAHARPRAPAAIVTAHTADDQAETLLMRLGRGSGLDGLAGMAPLRSLLQDGPVDLVRPLLGVSKQTLVDLLRRAGAAWLDDPSNESAQFERVRLRAAETHRQALGLSRDKLVLSASRLQRAREALELIAGQRVAALVDAHGGIYASIESASWAREPREIRVRILQRVLAAFGGAARPAQLAQIEDLETVMLAGRPVARTLGGCIVSQGRTTLRIYREPEREGLPEVALLPGEDVLWDWRFRVRYGDTVSDGVAPQPVVVRPLGLSAYATLRGELAPGLRPPARAAAGLPSIWRGGSLVAAPALPPAVSGDPRFSVAFLGLDRAVR
jgi:tRNA(Ile)-lysidine synthase